MARTKKETTEPTVEVKDNFDTVGEISEDTNVEYRDYIPTEECIPTASTLLNLAVSNNRNGGFLKGNIVRIKGASGVGKSAIASDLLVTAARNPNLKDYVEEYRDWEGGLLFDIATRYRDKSLAERIKVITPSDIGGKPSIEREVADMQKDIADGKHVIKVTDSLDTLNGLKKIEIDASNAELILKGAPLDKLQDSMMLSARAMSDSLKMIQPDIVRSGSLWIILSQIRATPTETKYTAGHHSSGGNAIGFMSSYTLHLSKGETLWDEDAYGNAKTVVGVEVRCVLEKNRGSGRNHTISLYFNTVKGFSDHRSVLQYLIDVCKYIKVVAPGWYACNPEYGEDWLIENGNKKEKWRKADILKLFRNNPEVWETARLKTEEAWRRNEEYIANQF